jgi:hypothetical protein
MDHDAVPRLDRPFGPDLPVTASGPLARAGRRSKGAQDPDAEPDLALDALERHDVGRRCRRCWPPRRRQPRSRVRVHLAAASGDPRAALSLLGRLEDATARSVWTRYGPARSPPPFCPAARAADGTDDVRLAAVDALGASPAAAASATPLLAGSPGAALPTIWRRGAGLGKLATPAAMPR